MKPFAKRLLALTSAAAITFTMIPAVHGSDKLDPDANAATIRTDVNGALRSATSPITRQELCSMVMAHYKTANALTDQDLGEPVRVFLDTNDLDVRNACELNIVSDMGAGFFAPDAAVTRQEFFTASVQLLNALGYPYSDDITMDLNVFADVSQITEEASQPIQVLMCIGAIEQADFLEPQRPITAEEAMTLLDSVMTYYADWQEHPSHPQRYLGEDVAEFALNYVGCRYVRGCKGPSKFDCSGLVCYVYDHFGYSMNRTTRDQWSQLGGTIKRANLLPGDILFFSRNGSSSGIFHVGIYIGDGEFVHAANPRKGVIVSDLSETWYANRYLGAKRVID